MAGHPTISTGQKGSRTTMPARKTALYTCYQQKPGTTHLVPVKCTLFARNK